MQIQDQLACITVPVTSGTPGSGTHVGTAFFVAQGLLLTCAHVVAGQDNRPSSRVTISWQGIDIPAEIVDWRAPPGPDLAILKVDVEPHGFVILDETAEAGDPLFAYGFPERQRKGDVATFESEGRPAYEGSLLKVKAGQAEPGMSGAPLLNLRTGGVCGVLRLTRDRHSDLGARAVVGAEVKHAFPSMWRTNDDARWTNSPWHSSLDYAQLAELGLSLCSSKMREFLQALRGVSEALPYQLITEGGVPHLSAIYIEQQQELQTTALPVGTTSAAPASSTVLHTLDQALDLYTHVLVEGGPGAGKSTLANHLTAECAAAWLSGRRLPYVAVTITARTLAESTESFDETLTRHIGSTLGVRLSGPLPADLFRRAPARDASWLVVVDGVDEVPIESRASFVETLKAKVEEPDGRWRYLVTTRPLRADERQALVGDQLGHYVLRLFERPQIRAFADAWFASRGGNLDDAQQFVRRLDQSRLLDVTTVPLLLTLAALVYEENRDDDLPTRRVDLYQRFVTVMLSVRERRQRTLAWLREEFEAAYGQQGARAAEDIFAARGRMLEHLALWRQVGKTGPLAEEGLQWLRREADLPGDVDDGWVRTRVILLLGKTGLVTQGLDGSLTFAHHTLREYLAARSLAGSSGPGTDSASGLVDRWRVEGWREIVLFILAIWSRTGVDVSGLVEQVLPVTGGAVFAGQALAEDIAIADGTKEIIVDQLITLASQPLRNSLDPLDALRTLGALRDNARALEGLARLAGAPGGDPVGRLLAAEALIRAGSREAAEEALVALASDPAGSSMFVAETATRLDSMGLRAEAIDILTTIAAHPATDQRGLLQAAISLHDLGAMAPARSVLSAMAADPSREPLLRLRAAEALERLGDASLAVDVHRALLDSSSDTPTEVRIAAAEALGRLVDREEAVRSLMAVVRDPSSGWSGLLAAESLKRLEAGEEAVTAQRDALNDLGAPLWRRVRIAAALRQSQGDPQAAALLEQVAQDHHAPLMTWATAVNDLRAGSLAPSQSAPPDGRPLKSLVELTRRTYLTGGERDDIAVQQLDRDWRRLLWLQYESGAPA
jgi:hypothetical protein